MNIDFSLIDAVNKRYSVRNYSDKKISEDVMNDIKLFESSLSNPFNKNVNFHYFGSEYMDGAKLRGSYGIIEGAKQYIATTIKLEPYSLEALGYELEVLVLHLANINIGTCWLGLTFDRNSFASTIDIGKNEVLPIITPYGYASDKKRFKDFAMRALVVADKRKSWDKLFFKNDFNTPLLKQDIPKFVFALDMVRLAPSASNKQPWRILNINNTFHFFEYKKPGYSNVYSYDIQRIDMGIAAAHFDLAVKEQGILGNFYFDKQPDIELPKNVEYVFSWQSK